VNTGGGPDTFNCTSVFPGIGASTPYSQHTTKYVAPAFSGALTIARFGSHASSLHAISVNGPVQPFVDKYTASTVSSTVVAVSRHVENVYVAARFGTNLYHTLLDKRLWHDGTPGSLVVSAFMISVDVVKYGNGPAPGITSLPLHLSFTGATGLLTRNCKLLLFVPGAFVP
jgi:hypothetical protein